MPMTMLEDEKYLVILPYYQGGSQGNEIRLALNSWKKFCQFDYHFVVIGQFDDDLTKEFDWAEFISTKRVIKSTTQYTPHLDIQHKLEIAYNLFHDKYKAFIYTADDSYAIKSFTVEELKTIHYHQSEFTGVKYAPISFWKHDKWKTRQLLDKENLPHINYTTHFPRYYEFDKWNELWNKYNMREESYVPEDIYFNSYNHSEPVLDSTIRLGIWNKEIFENDFQSAVANPNIKFVCNSVEGWSPELEKALGEIIYE